MDVYFMNIFWIPGATLHLIVLHSDILALIFHNSNFNSIRASSYSETHSLVNNEVVWQ